ncbi:hypothetical protein VNO80_06444 [Phaseolus coccineus]|uniref:Uncharacterized protein n=1 Tax=Phaseolus coccineus TaxID=3886 RepID=A0AAN9NGU9_PHACN
MESETTSGACLSVIGSHVNHTLAVLLAAEIHPNYPFLLPLHFSITSPINTHIQLPSSYITTPTFIYPFIHKSDREILTKQIFSFSLPFSPSKFLHLSLLLILSLLSLSPPLCNSPLL